MGQEPESMRKLFIGGLNLDTTCDTLKEFYEQWGEIVDAVVIKDNVSKRSRGFGFVTYAQSCMIDAAQAARPHTIDGKTVESKRAIPRNEINSDSSPAVKKLFVAGLKDDVTDDDIASYFSEYGNVTTVKQILDRETGSKRGFGFVEFDDYDSADRACMTTNHELNGKPLEVKKATGPSKPRGGGGGFGGGRGGGRGSRGGWNQGNGHDSYRGGNNYGNDGGWNQRGNDWGSNGGGGGWNQQQDWGSNGGGGNGGGGWNQHQDWGSNGGGGGWGSDYNNDYGVGPIRGGGGQQRSAPYNSGGSGSGGGRGGRGRGGGRSRGRGRGH